MSFQGEHFEVEFSERVALGYDVTGLRPETAVCNELASAEMSWRPRAESAWINARNTAIPFIFLGYPA